MKFLLLSDHLSPFFYGWSSDLKLNFGEYADITSDKYVLKVFATVRGRGHVVETTAQTVYPLSENLHIIMRICISTYLYM